MIRLKVSAKWALGSVLIFLIFGCSTPPKVSLLADHYNNKFTRLNLPTESEIKAKSLASHQMQSSYNTVWKSMVLVAMQYAPLIYAKKEQGVIVAPPYALYAEKQDGVIVYIHFMKELYNSAAESNKVAIPIRANTLNFYQRTILNQVQTQAESQKNVEPGGKWSYLFKH